MAQTTHKTATSVTLAPVAEKSQLEQFVLKYWIHSLVVAGVISAVVVYRFQAGQGLRQAREESWDRLTSSTVPKGFPEIPSAEPAVLSGLATELAGQPVGPWARWLEANSCVAQRDYPAALVALGKLRSEHPTHQLVVGSLSFGGPAPESPVDYMARSLGARAEWEKLNPQVFSNPPVPGDVVRVSVATTAGTFVLALYPSNAPEQVAGFLQNVSDRYYDGTTFYHIDPQMGVDGGDPNTKSPDLALWGQGGKDRFVARRDTGLFHFAGAVSAGIGAASGESLTSQFSLLTADRHDLDGSRVVFGVVESGLDIVKQIGQGEVAEDSAGRPKLPVAITTMEQL